jgi:hypothetical protein
MGGWVLVMGTYDSCRGNVSWDSIAEGRPERPRKAGGGPPCADAVDCAFMFGVGEL